MAEKRTGMKSSLSADDVGRPAKKPGKISADFLAQFESDPALSGSSSSLQFAHASQGHGSSSDTGSASGSHEHLAPARRTNVRISEPFPHSSNEEIAAAIDHDEDDRTLKKRKSIWKWGPLKKVRRFFSRKKGSRRAKSCEDLPTSSTSQKGLTVDESQRYRASSTPLHHKADIHIKSSPVMRSRSMPPKNPNSELKELKKRQASSHEEVREERSPKPVSKTFSLPTLNSNVIHCRKEIYTEEGAVSFENDPRESTIEGLQAAHDKIKAAPKKRRPPTRARSRTASLGLQGKTPDTQGQKAHKLSMTDPRDLTRERDSGFLLNSSSVSDVMTKTIFETSEAGEEEDGQAVTSPKASQRDKEREDAVRDDVMSRVNDVLARTSGPSRLATTGSSLREPKPGSKTDVKEGADLDLQTKNISQENDLNVAEKRSFTDNIGNEKGTKFGSATKEISESKELTVAGKRRSLTDNKGTEGEETKFGSKTKKNSENKELTVAEKRRSFTDNIRTEKGTKFGSTSKEISESKELTVAEKRRSLTDNKGTEKGTKFGSTAKEISENKELTVAGKRRSFTDNKGIEEETKFGSTTKKMSENKEVTVAEKRRSFTDKKASEEDEMQKFGRTSQGITGVEELTLAKRRSFIDKKDGEKTTRENLEKIEASVQEKRHSDDKSAKSTENRSSSPIKESVPSWAESVRSSQAESKIVMAENTCQLESEVTFDDFEFDKILDTTENFAEEIKKESKANPKPQEPANKEVSKAALPFKRGKSWSNSHKPRLQEFPFRQETTLSCAAKKDNNTNILAEKREFISRQDQGKDRKKPDDTTEESVPFRFSRTKSWSYGTKPVDVDKANAKENKNPVENKGENEPAWIASAKQKSRRISQLLQEDETSTENQISSLTKPNKNQINKPTIESKPQISQKPLVKSPQSPLGLVVEKKISTVPSKPSQPSAVAKEQLKPSTQQKTSKQLVQTKVDTKPAQQKPSVVGRNSATLPATKDRSTAQTVVDKPANRRSLNLYSKENTNKKTFGSVKIEKCIVCGTTVYQMEKCKFDDSVLHRNCIKCTVCNRHLTVGNFVMAESKIYCKPHSQTVTVST